LSQKASARNRGRHGEISIKEERRDGRYIIAPKFSRRKRFLRFTKLLPQAQRGLVNLKRGGQKDAQQEADDAEHDEQLDERSAQPTTGCKRHVDPREDAPSTRR
jgi:hypothetical protein